MELLGLSRRRLEELCHDLRLPKVHAATLYRQLFKRGSQVPWLAAELPQKLIQHLQQDAFAISPPLIAQSQESAYDGSVKFVFQFSDGQQIESVLMPEKKRLTACLSTQVGCRQACVFCHTGRMGLKRNLTAAEIVGQVFALEQWLRQNPTWLTRQALPKQQRVSNIVFMGMGEPLDNVDQVINAIEVMNDPLGFNLPLRKISVSTAGHLDGLVEITKQLPQVRLALSLHAPNDVERSKLLPINRRWPLGLLMEFFRSRAPHIKHHLLVQYTVIKGVNDSSRHAAEIGELLRGIPAKINLIPLNPVGPSRLQSPDAEALQAFRGHLQEQGFRVLVRYSKGQDIAAACGQLVQ